MKEILAMKPHIIFSIICVQLLIFGCWSSENFNHEDKKAIMRIATEVMEASVFEDIPRLLSFLDKKIIVKVERDGEEKYSYDYDSYEEFLTKAFFVIHSYQYELRNERFYSGKNGKIIFEFELEEKYEYRGETINEQHSEVWEILKVGDSYKILSITCNCSDSN